MFNEQLRKLRKEFGISQKELAAQLSVSQQTVAKWETDGASPNPKTLVKICDILGVSGDSLIGRVDREEEQNQDELVKFALFGTTEIDDELLDDVKKLAILQKQLREEKMKE